MPETRRCSWFMICSVLRQVDPDGRADVPVEPDRFMPFGRSLGRPHRQLDVLHEESSPRLDLFVPDAASATTNPRQRCLGRPASAAMLAIALQEARLGAIRTKNTHPADQREPLRPCAALGPLNTHLIASACSRPANSTATLATYSPATSLNATKRLIGFKP